jgi:hypothetical protein
MAAACGLTLAIAATARAQAPADVKPVAVVAINSYEKLMQDIDYIGGLVQMPGASQMVDAQVGNMTGGAGLAGFDKSKPIGLLVDMSMMFPNFAAYLPVSDQSALLGILAPLGVTSTDAGNGVTQISAFGQNAFAKTAGGWMVLGMSPETLTSMSVDPSQVFGGLTQQYDVAVVINVQNLPQALRAQFTAMANAAQQGLSKLPNESDAQFAARQQAVQTQAEYTTRMLQELDQVKLGLSISGQEQKVYLDINMLALPGSALAQELAAGANATTNFAGFTQADAAASLSFAANVEGVQAAHLEQMVNQVRGQLSASIDAEAKPEQREAIRTALGEFLDAIQATVKAGKIDGGAVVLAAPGAISGVAGGLITEPAKIESGLKKLAEALAGSGADALPEIKWGAETHGDITFHTMQIPVPDAKAQSLFGEQLDIVVGLGGQSAYVAWGRNAAETLKKVIDANAAGATPTTPFRLTIAAGKIVDVLKSVAEDDKKPVFEMVSGLLASAGGKDHINIIGRPIDNGSQYRIEVEQGVIQAIATGAMMGGLHSAPATALVPASESR